MPVSPMGVSVILSDVDYLRAMGEGRIAVSPDLDPIQYQPASIDLRLGGEFLVFRDLSEELRGDPIDPKYGVYKAHLPSVYDDVFVLNPGAFVLGTTHERVTLGSGYSARVEGRSSVGRLGVLVHVTAGFIDPGFSGQITLEMCNLQPNPVLLEAGMRICQIVFSEMRTPSRNVYDGKYNRQSGVQASRIEEDFKG